MNIYLLTHSRELERKTNTGRLVKEVLGAQCSIFAWQRKHPNTELLQHIQNEDIALLYPCPDSNILNEQNNTFESFILIDATWQEAQKMYNHSPYLHDLPKASLKSQSPSIYTLRRNQKETGLCTAERVSILLNLDDKAQQASRLNESLKAHIKNLL